MRNWYKELRNRKLMQKGLKLSNKSLPMESESVCRSVASYSLRPHGLRPARLFCPWHSLRKNNGVGSHSLPQGIFPAQGSNPGFPHCRQILYLLQNSNKMRRLRAAEQDINVSYMLTKSKQQKLPGLSVKRFFGHLIFYYSKTLTSKFKMCGLKERLQCVNDFHKLCLNYRNSL